MYILWPRIFHVHWPGHCAEMWRRRHLYSMKGAVFAPPVKGAVGSRATLIITVCCCLFVCLPFANTLTSGRMLASTSKAMGAFHLNKTQLFYWTTTQNNASLDRDAAAGFSVSFLQPVKVKPTSPHLLKKHRCWREREAWEQSLPGAAIPHELDFTLLARTIISFWSTKIKIIKN